MSVKMRDPLRGMPVLERDEFDKAPRVVREEYIAWWNERENSQSAHRDTWPAWYGGWKAHARITRQVA